MEQKLSGDASVAVFFVADLRPVLKRFGNHGYRAMQLEADILGGKLYHTAYAQRLGATGLAFFDEDVTNFFAACRRQERHISHSRRKEHPPKGFGRLTKSDRIRVLDLPQNGSLLPIAKSIESAMKTGKSADVRRACAEFLAATSDFYKVPPSAVRVLAARPLRVREHWATELFGDYHPETMLIRVWMRTAVRRQVTSFGTFLSTLCHEWCHHLDYQRFGFRGSWHTRGFYERTAVLYHHARGTPPKRLFWAAVPGGRYRIDWPRTNRGV